MKFRTTLIAGILISLFASNANAHDNATLDAMPTPNGGMVRMAGAYHLELVLHKDQARIYITDHAGQPISSKGGAAELTLMGNKKHKVTLTPAGNNLLQGATAPLDETTYRAIVRFKLSGQTEQLIQYSGLPKK